ncbi:carbon storage regulator [Paludisphaera sp.]|uniref:carbon storage regulator n=1 Tax=Paludisphaera sp. TaxID=2017432 RepID=UPI00301E3713
MLVLSRKPMQSLVIDQEIKITVIRVEGNQVRLGIEAPGHVRILRGELVDESEPTTEYSEILLDLASAAS